MERIFQRSDRSKTILKGKTTGKNY
jgi:hypothetical protein